MWITGLTWMRVIVAPDGGDGLKVSDATIRS